MRRPWRGTPGTLGAMADAPAERRHLQFTLYLHRIIGADGGTVCLSPYPGESALGMDYRAARGSAAADLQHLLDPEASDVGKQVELLREAAFLSAERGSDEPVLEVSNTLWAWDQLPLNDSFTVELSGWPGAKV